MAELLDGREVPWNFVLEQKAIDPKPAHLPPLVAHKTTDVVAVPLDEVEVFDRTSFIANAGLTGAQIAAALRRNIQELMVIRSNR